MKTKFFYILLTVVLSLSTLSVFADGAKGKKVSSKNRSNSVSNLITHVKDAEMEMETWMTSLREFNSKSEISDEKPIEIEAWMLNNFDESMDAENFQEDELVLENWMMNDFNVNNNTENFQENELDLEGWMLESFDAKTQEIFTEEELEIESWMCEVM